jgi:hypothetical protein
LAASDRALVADSNPHIIGFFAQLQWDSLSRAVDRHLRSRALQLEADRTPLPACTRALQQSKAARTGSPAIHRKVQYTG